MDLGLADRVYVVTGGTRGLGRATADALVAMVKPYFAFGLAPVRMMARGLRFWALAELDGLRLLLKRLWVRAPAPDTGASRAPASR